jgi:HD-like signal output (HDOD) protein/CheY-like chemotaxis protein
MKRRILFVDDEPNILDGLRNCLRRQRGEWDMVFACGGPAAIVEMEKAPFDVIVADMRMAGMGGSDLLRWVKEVHPGMARLVLSGHADRSAILEVLPFAHQYLSKPCNVGDMRTTIERVCALQTLLHDDAIRSVIGSLDKLPSVPQSYWELTRAVNDPQLGMADIAKIVERDPAMSVKILQLVNSAYFGMAHDVSSIEKAVSFLGSEMLKALAIGSTAFEMTKMPTIEGFSLDQLQASSLASARLVRRFLGDGRRADEAFTAALIRDIGTMVLAVALPETYGEILQEARDRARPVHAIEQERIGVTHAEIGAYLQGIWGLPFPIVQAVAFHHNPSAAPDASCEVLAALHVADTLTDSAWRPGSADGLDLGFLERAGVTARLGEWRAMAAEEIGNLN